MDHLRIGVGPSESLQAHILFRAVPLFWESNQPQPAGTNEHASVARLAGTWSGCVTPVPTATHTRIYYRPLTAFYISRKANEISSLEQRKKREACDRFPGWRTVPTQPSRHSRRNDPIDGGSDQVRFDVRPRWRLRHRVGVVLQLRSIDGGRRSPSGITRCEKVHAHS